MQRLLLYCSLTKPKVLLGNVLSAIAGFLLASSWEINPVLFLTTTLGITLVIASACVLNNYFDRDIDSLMERTKERALANGTVNSRNAVVFGVSLGVIGSFLLLYTNLLVVIIGLVGFIDYLVFYAMFSKRHSAHGTLVGAISGAMPILAGYVAVRGQIDLGAVIVFLTLFFWQMPAFYSISIYRRDEYKAAHIPVISVAKGVKATIKQIFFYTLAFLASIILLYASGYVGILYLITMMVFASYWIYLAWLGLKANNPDKWAKSMFRYALIILLIFCLIISINPK